MRSRLDIQGLAAAQQRLTAAGSRARRPEPALRSRATLQALRDSETRRFQANRFRANSPKWQQYKRRHGLSPKRLQASGLLRMILTAGTWGTTNSAVAFSAWNGVLTWGLKGGRSPVFYARIWADRDRRRRPVYIDKRARVDIGDIVMRYVVEGTTS